MFISVISLMSCEKKMTRYETEFIGLFDTLTRIVTYSYNKKDFTEHSQLIYDSLKEYHELYDIYNNYPGINNMKTINDNAGIAPVKVDKRIIDLLLFSREWYGKTGGKLNVAMGSVLKIWHDYRTEGIDNPEEAELPPLELLQEASLHTDMGLTMTNSTVYLQTPK